MHNKKKNVVTILEMINIYSSIGGYTAMLGYGTHGNENSWRDWVLAHVSTRSLSYQWYFLFIHTVSDYKTIYAAPLVT